MVRKVARPLQREGTKQEPAKNGQKTQPSATGQQQGAAVPFKAMPWSVKRMLAQAENAAKLAARPQQADSAVKPTSKPQAPSSAPPPRLLQPPGPPPPPTVPMEVTPPWRRKATLVPWPQAMAAQPAATQHSPPSPEVCRGQGNRKRRRRKRHQAQQAQASNAERKRLPDPNGVVAVSLSSDDEPMSSSSSPCSHRHSRSAGSSSSGCSSCEEVPATKEASLEPQLAKAGKNEEMVPPVEVPETPKVSQEAPLELSEAEDSDSSEVGEPAG